MTNKEKFKEVFGYEAHTNRCPIYCYTTGGDVCCPYYKPTCSAGDWWNAEYKESATENNLGVDCISRKAVFETIDDCNSDGLKGIFCSYDDGERFKEYIKNLSPVTPQTRKGHWISHREHCEKLGAIPSGLGVYAWCSECDCAIDVGEWHRNHYNYCPNCGADMRESEVK